MLVQDIKNFSQIRYNARAYLAYLFERNIPNRLPQISIEAIILGLDKIAHEIENFDAFYILAPDGTQIGDNISLDEKKVIGNGVNRSNKAYFYRAVREKRCVLTDPYPSRLTGELCVSASEPIYDENGVLLYVVCIDVSLNDILRMISPNKIDCGVQNFARIVYAVISLVLFCITAVLLVLGIKSILFKSFFELSIAEMFESTIILTLALALFDLVKAIFDEEVLGKHSNDGGSVARTMMRFLCSIVIALAIEALMLVFKFSITDPSQITYAVYLIGGVAVLLLSLSAFAWVNKKVL